MDNLNSCIDSTTEKNYFTECEIYQLVDKIPNICDKILILAMFDGICGRHFRELMYLKPGNFDSENNTVTLCTGRTIFVSNKLCELVNEFSRESGRNTEISFGWKDPSTNMSELEKSRIIYNRICKIMSEFGYSQFKTNTLTTSGKISMILRRCEELGITGHDYLLSNHLAEVNEQYGGKVVRATFEKVFGKYLPQ